MLQTTYSGNPNGKLLSDCWADIRLDAITYATGTDHEIYQNKHYLGTATVVAAYKFPYKDLHSGLSYLICGNNFIYLKTIIEKMYGVIDANREVVFVVFKWTSRNMAQQDDLFSRYYELQKEKHILTYNDERNANATQSTLNFG